MTEKPTFCPVCKRMQVGVHGKDHAQGKAATKRTEPVHGEPASLKTLAEPAVLPMRTMTVAEAKEMFPPAPKFDKRAYQREYMRKWRARDKA